jgi:hypothetical protein
MRNISTVVRSHYDDDRYMWAIIIRRFCDMKKPHLAIEDGLGVTEHLQPDSQSLYSKPPCNEVPTIWRTLSATKAYAAVAH